MSDGNFEVETVNTYPHIPAEIPGVLIESNLQPGEGDVQVNHIPTMSYMDAAAQANAGLVPTPRVSQTIGVEPTHNVVDLTDADDDDDEDVSSEVVHKVEYVLENDNNQPEDEEDQAEEPNKEYGRGMRIRRLPEYYVPIVEGISYTTGVNNLCYKGTRYTLEEIIPGDGVIPYKMGVLNVNSDAPMKATARNWMDDSSLDKNLLGVVLVQQYNLRK